ncbi:MAG: hypothetical protein ACREHG_03655, partial [Candidatus Saccharimonadales bacterium]
SGIAPMDTSCKSVKINKILGDSLIISHSEILDFSFGIADRLIRSEVSLEFSYELFVIFFPWNILIGIKECQFEPLQSGSLKVGKRKINFCGFGAESSRPIIEV